MMFDRKRPCSNCPFRRGRGELFRMNSARLVEIVSGAAFQCHKTIDYSQWGDDERRQGQNPQQCAGLMALLRDEGHVSPIMVAGMIHGALDMNALDPGHTAYGSFAEAFEAHTGAPPPIAELRAAMEGRFEVLSKLNSDE